MRAPAPERRTNAARLFGYDVFVSFALGPPPRGSRSYASDLARRLRERDFTVFFSEEEAPVGDQLDDTLQRALHRSRILVVIANSGTLSDPRWVRTEVEEFRRKHPERPIIPINIGGALQTHGAVAEPWLRFSDKIWIDDTQSAGDQGVVSDSVLERLVTAPNAMRSRTRWRWTVRAAFAVLSLVTASALWFAWSDRQNANLARQQGRQAQANATKAERNADQARKNAATARENEERARKNEGRALIAEKQAVQEAAAARTAERIAQSGRLAAESQLARASDTRLALLLATEAWKIEPTMESRRALFEALHEPVAIPLAGSRAYYDSSKTTDYSADGRFIAADGDASVTVTGTGDGRLVRIWDAQTRRELQPFRAAGGVNQVAFSPDGSMLAAATSGGVQLWNMATRAAVVEPVLDPDGAGAVAWSPDGQILAFETSKGVVLWDPKAKSPIDEPIDVGNHMVSQLSFSEHGTYLAVVQSDTARMFEVATRTPLEKPITWGGLTSIRFLSDETVAFNAGVYGSTRFEVKLQGLSSEEMETAFIDESKIAALTHAPAAGLYATGSEDGGVRLWEGWFTRPLRPPLYAHGSPVTRLAFTRDGTGLVSRSEDRLVQWLLNTGFHRFRRNGPPLPSMGGEDGMIVSRDGRWLLFLDNHERLEWYELPAARRVAAADVPGGWEIFAVAPDGTVALHAESQLTLRGPGKQRPRCTIATEAEEAVFSPDSRLMATWSWRRGRDGTVRLWRATDCRKIADVTRLNVDDKPRAVAFSFDGASLLVAEQAGVRRWNIAARRFEGTVFDLPDVFVIAGDAQGRFVAATHRDTIALSRLGSKAPPVLLSGTRAHIVSVAFSPDGLWLASAGLDGQIVLWDLSTHQRAGSPIVLSQGTSRSVAFTRDGRTLVTTSGVIGDRPELWHVGAETWADQACRLAQRNFTCEEWQRAFGAEAYRKTCPAFAGPRCTTTAVRSARPGTD